MVRAHRSAGFTLIETLVALTVLGLISVMLTAGLASGGQTWRRMTVGQRSGQAVAAAQEALRNRLQSAYPAALFGGSRPAVDFRGEAAQVEFLAPGPLADGPHALRRYVLSVTPGRDLSLSWRWELSPDPPGAPISTVVLSQVQAVHIDYFGAPQAGQPRAWRPRWVAAERPPELVRIGAEFAPGDPRVWPALVVRLRADVDDACVLRASARGCVGRS